MRLLAIVLATIRDWEAKNKTKSVSQPCLEFLLLNRRSNSVRIRTDTKFGLPVRELQWDSIAIACLQTAEPMVRLHLLSYRFSNSWLKLSRTGNQIGTSRIKKALKVRANSNGQWQNLTYYLILHVGDCSFYLQLLIF